MNLSNYSLIITVYMLFDFFKMIFVINSCSFTGMQDLFFHVKKLISINVTCTYRYDLYDQLYSSYCCVLVNIDKIRNNNTRLYKSPVQLYTFLLILNIPYYCTL